MNRKGMTLVEVLIAMGLAVVIMAATFTIVEFCSRTYDKTSETIMDNNNTYDAVGIINRYIRESSYCAVTSDGKTLYLSLDGSSIGEVPGLSYSIQLSLKSEKLYMNRTGVNDPLLIADNVYDIQWRTAMNGVKYTAYEKEADGAVTELFYGFAAKRGR